MKEIIQYFNEVCINELLKVSENLYRDPSKFAEYIEELKETLNKLGVEIIKETLEEMDMAIKNSVKRKMNWHVEKKDCEKDLITNYICLFNYLFISSQMSAKPYFIGSTGILLLW